MNNFNTSILIFARVISIILRVDTNADTNTTTHTSFKVISSRNTLFNTDITINMNFFANLTITTNQY